MCIRDRPIAHVLEAALSHRVRTHCRPDSRRRLVGRPRGSGRNALRKLSIAMRIGIVSPEFPPEKGGIQTYAIEYARELARRGHDVTVFTQPHAEGELAGEAFRIEPSLLYTSDAADE